MSSSYKLRRFFPSEVKFIREKGSEVLMHLWNVEDVDFWNPYRLPNPPE